MANVLGELFSDIAKSIRYGFGEIEKMKPKEFPAKIKEIVDFIGGDSDEIDKMLDSINGEVIGETLYYVTFKNYDGTEMGTEAVYEGYDCPNPVASGLFGTPEKEATKYIRYNFAGWTLTEGGSADANALLEIEENRTLYAVFEPETIYLAKGSWQHEEFTDSYMVWTLNPDYILSIEANGSRVLECSQYLNIPNSVYPPWWGFRNEITALVLTGTGHIVGSGWLYNCPNLANVSLHDGVTSIGISAFRNCKSLTSVALPARMRVIGHNAFDGASIKSITIPATTYSIMEYAFRCDTLQSVVFERLTSWNYSSDYRVAHNGNGTIVTEEEASDPTFAVDIFKHGDTWYNTDLS